LEPQEKSAFKHTFWIHGTSSLEKDLWILNGYSEDVSDNLKFSIEVLPEDENLLRLTLEYHSNSEVLLDEDYDSIYDMLHNKFIHCNDHGDYHLQLDYHEMRFNCRVVELI
jgi:hypothetical protein